MGEIFRGNAAITWQDADDISTERVLLLREPLRDWRPAHVQAAYRAVSLDQTAIQVFTVGVGVDELIGRVRFSDQPQTLLDLIKAGTKLRTINYFPDLDDPARTVACYLTSPLSPTQLTMDGETGTKFGEQEVELRFRRTTNTAFATDITMQGTLFSYTAGGSLGLGTFTRATAATYRDKFGVGQSAAAGKPRVAWTGAQPRLGLEAARTQLVTDPENFGAWSVVATPVLAAGQADPFGGTAAYSVNDDNAAALESIFQNVAFTGDGTKAVSFFTRQGTLAANEIRVFDNTASIERHRIGITWSGGIPTLATNAGAGTLFTPIAYSAAWWLVPFSATGIVAANTNLIQYWPGRFSTTADTGTAFIFGVNAWNAVFPSSYQGPSLTTRNADSLTFGYLAKPQATFWYHKFVELGSNNSTTMGYAGIGDASTSGSCFFNASSATAYQFTHRTATDVTSTVTLTPSYGDTIELLGLLYGDGSVQLIGSKNGAAEVTGTRSAVKTFAATWATQTVRLNAYSAGTEGFSGIIQSTIRQMLTAPTLAQARTAR